MRRLRVDQESVRIIRIVRWGGDSPLVGAILALRALETEPGASTLANPAFMVGTTRKGRTL